MENASKALLMAASVLIGVLILSIAVYLFLSFGRTSAEIHKENEEQQLIKFNSQFTKYEGKSDNTIYDVVTVARLAKENNDYYGLKYSQANKGNYYIKVLLETVPFSDNESEDSYNSKIKNDIDSMNSGNLPTYKCKVEISDITGRVYQVKFTKN